jgi:N4-gp56 family major capsid protein
VASPNYNFNNAPNIAANVDWTPTVFDLEIRRAALPLFAFRQFARDVRSSYPGDSTTLKILKTSTVTTGGSTLAAGTEIPRTTATNAMISYSPAEYGNAISPETRQLTMTPYALQEELAHLLSVDAAKVLDTAVRSVLIAGITAGANSFNMGGGGTLVTTTVPTAAGATTVDPPAYRLGAAGIENAVDYLNVQNAPKINRSGVGEGYIGILHPYQARGLKKDANFVAAIEYSASNRLFNNEIGFWEGVYWIETSRGYTFTNTTVNYCALIFGAKCFGEYKITDLSHRTDPATDFGRQTHHAWYADLGWAIEFSNYIAGVWSLTGATPAA